MTSTLKLDPLTGDLAIASGKGTLATSDAQIAQRVATALRLYRGENRYNTGDGFPWLEEIFAKKIPPRALEERLRAYVRKVPGVTSVDSVAVVFDGRLRKASISIKVNGTIPVELTP